jgi:hypothetical protein
MDCLGIEARALLGEAGGQSPELWQNLHNFATKALHQL